MSVELMVCSSSFVLWFYYSRLYPKCYRFFLSQRFECIPVLARKETCHLVEV